MTIEPIMQNYCRSVLYQTELFEIVSIEWTSASISPMHNHGWSQCLVVIEEGQFHNTLNLGFKNEVQMLRPGQVIQTPIGARHEIRCLSSRGKTLHIYTPKVTELSEAGQFKVETLASELRTNLHLLESTNFETLTNLLMVIRNKSITTHSPYFMNQLFSGILPEMLLAEQVISETKTTLATYEASPIFSTIESEVIDSLGKLVGWSKDSRNGVCVPGGSAANLMAIHCARQKLLPEFKKSGMDGTPLKVFVSSEAHYSFKKACAILGIGTNNLIQVPVDEKGRMIPSQLDEIITEHRKSGIPLLVCATAGTTVFGAFDPLYEISLVCKKHDVWLHTDGAWGGPALFSQQTRSLVQGIEFSDSITFDAHKLFGASLTCSFMLTRHSRILLDANDVSGGEYLFHSDDETLDRGRLSWQCGRRADAMSFWTIWKSLGTQGLGQVVERFLGIREMTLEWIKLQDRLELVAQPEYLNICVRVHPPDGNFELPQWSQRVRETLRDRNLAMVNYSTNENGSFLRLILANPYLEFDHVRQILEWALEIK